MLMDFSLLNQTKIFLFVNFRIQALKTDHLRPHKLCVILQGYYVFGFSSTIHSIRFSKGPFQISHKDPNVSPF